MAPYIRQGGRPHNFVAICGITLVITLLLFVFSFSFAVQAAPDAAVAMGPSSAPVSIPYTEPAAPTSQSWWQASLLPVFGVFMSVLAVFVVVGLRKLTQLVEAKWSVDIPDSVERMMDAKAHWAIAWVEEKAEKRLLHGDGKKTPGAEKITEVVDLLQEFADSLGYGHDWQRNKLEALAEGVLHLERDRSIGSSGERAMLLDAKKKNENS